MIKIITTLKRLSPVLLAVFTLIGFSAKAQQTISLQQAVDSTIKNNLTIKQAQLTEALADEDYHQAKYNQLPTLSANPQAGYYFGKVQIADQLAYSSSALNVQGQANLSVTLYQGGQLHNQIIANKLTLDVDKTSTDKVKNDLLRDQCRPGDQLHRKSSHHSRLL